MRQFHSWLKAVLLGAAILPGLAAAAGEAPAPPPAQPAKPEIVQLLFVQNARAVAIDKAKRTLTLKGVSPSTLFFSDRPQRIAGHFHTRDEFLPLWVEGKDSFLKDPPNGTLSVFEKGKEDLVDVVVKLQNPRMKGEDLIYDITLISGELPKAGGPAALFIDIIGLPWTPLSYAGVARRWTRRAVVFGSATTAAAAGAAIAAYPAVYPAVVPATVQVTETVKPPPPPPSAAQKLKELQSLYDQGLISRQEYEAKKNQVLQQIVQ
jgi:hypothetical protein